MSVSVPQLNKTVRTVLAKDASQHQACMQYFVESTVLSREAAAQASTVFRHFRIKIGDQIPQ
jgi:hypothetical protein